MAKECSYRLSTFGPLVRVHIAGLVSLVSSGLPSSQCCALFIIHLSSSLSTTTLIARWCHNRDVLICQVSHLPAECLLSHSVCSVVVASVMMLLILVLILILIIIPSLAVHSQFCHLSRFLITVKIMWRWQYHLAGSVRAELRAVVEGQGRQTQSSIINRRLNGVSRVATSSQGSRLARPSSHPLLLLPCCVNTTTTKTTSYTCVQRTNSD